MNASIFCIPPRSKNEDFLADIAAKPFAGQRDDHHGTYCIKILSSQSRTHTLIWAYRHDLFVLLACDLTNGKA